MYVSHGAHKLEMQKPLVRTRMRLREFYPKETDSQTLWPTDFTFSVSLYQTACSQRHVTGHLIHTASVSSSISLFICVLWSSPSSSPGGDVCLAAGTFPFLCWPVPRCICRGSGLSLQKAQGKKIRKLALMKTRSTVSFSLLLLLSLPLLPWTWKDERGELKLIQTSSPQRQMTGLWSVSVRVWVFRSLILSPLPLSTTFFLWTEGESLEVLKFNHLLTSLMITASSEGQAHFIFL